MPDFSPGTPLAQTLEPRGLVHRHQRQAIKGVVSLGLAAGIRVLAPVGTVLAGCAGGGGCRNWCRPANVTGL